MPNAEYTKVLGKVLNRPTFFAAPAPALRIAIGGMADALLLASQRMQPAKLQETGYRFRYPELEETLRHLLGR
jgi:NAD dependent epimerase/dehydratase family enzyme